MREYIVKGSKKKIPFAYNVSEYYAILNALSIMGFKNTKEKYVFASGENLHEHIKSGQGGLGQDMSRTAFLKTFITSMTEEEALDALLGMFNHFYGVDDFKLMGMKFTGKRIVSGEIFSGSDWTIIEHSECDIHKPLIDYIEGDNNEQ